MKSRCTALQEHLLLCVCTCACVHVHVHVLVYVTTSAVLHVVRHERKVVAELLWLPEAHYGLMMLLTTQI